MEIKKTVLFVLLSLCLCSVASAATVSWISGTTAPGKWTIDPVVPNESEVISFSGPTYSIFSNSCIARMALGGTETITVDSVNKVIELSFVQPRPDICTAEYEPVCGLQGNFGPLAPGDWIFKCDELGMSFEIHFAVTGTTPSTPNTYYVDWDVVSVENDGTSWKKAFNNLQDALAVASNSDIILIAGGEYKPDQGAIVIPGDRSASFEIKDSLNLIGGFAGYGYPNPDKRNTMNYPTILSGDLNNNDINDVNSMQDNSYQVVRITGSDPNVAQLDGLTIVSGNANGPTGFNSGAGLYIDGASPLLIDCTISDNVAGSGAAIASINASPKLYNCVIADNNSLFFGGGLFSLIGDVELTNCLLTVNYAGLAVTMGSSAIFNIGANLILTNCTLADNFAPSGMAINSYALPSQLTKHLFIYNSILYNGPNEIMTNYPDTVYVSNSNLLGGWSGDGTDNIDVDPEFVNPGQDGDYHLIPTSQCINKGNNGLLPVDIIDLDVDGDVNELLPIDLDGQSRVLNDLVDMGAYEQLISDVDYNVPDENGASLVTVERTVTTTFNLNFQGILRVEVTPTSPAGGDWTAWFDPDPNPVGPGTVTVTVRVRGENVDISKVPPGYQQLAVLRFFIMPNV